MTTPTEHVRLRPVADSDIDPFWRLGTDPAVLDMAGVTRRYHDDRDAFDRFWAAVRADADVLPRTVLVGDEVAGHAATFGADEREITYTIGRAFWDRGVASEAVRQLLLQDPTRPLFADVVADNLGSRRVLEKNDFVLADIRREHSLRRAAEIDVHRFVLER